MPARVLGVGVRATAANIWTAIQTFGSGLLKLRNPANTFDYIFKGGAIVADRDVTMPLLTGADVLVTEGMAQTLSSKRVTLRAPTVTQSATPAINTDVTDVAHITGLAQAITSMTTSLTGTPSQGDKLHIDITDDGTARAITWGASFESSAIALPTTTILNARLDIDFVWNTVTSKWRCVGATVAPAVADLTGTTLPAGITASSLTSVGTLASPVLTTPDINGGTADALTSLAVRSTGTGAFDLKIANAENLTVGAKTLTIQSGDADRTLILGASPSLSGTNTGDQTITLTGEVTGSGTGSFAATVAATHSGSAHHAQQSLFETIAVSGQTSVVADSATDTLTLVAGTNITITTDATTDAITITAAGASGANTALSNLAAVAINLPLLPDAAAADDFGSATLPFKDIFLAGSSGTPGTNNFRITGASTSGTRVITLPDATGTLLYSGGALGTPSSGTGTNITGIPAASILAGSFGAGAYVISTSLQAATIELGHATDTTVSRSAAGVVAVEGVVIPSISSTDTLTNKRVTKRTPTITQSATPAINTDVTDVAHITGLAQAITSMTSSLTGTPVEGDTLRIDITDNGTARAITWGASFEASTVALPTTTVVSARLDIGFVWNTVTSKWRCVAKA